MGNLCNLPFGGGDIEEVGGWGGGSEGAAGVEGKCCVRGHVAFGSGGKSLFSFPFQTMSCDRVRIETGSNLSKQQKVTIKQCLKSLRCCCCFAVLRWALK